MKKRLSVLTAALLILSMTVVMFPLTPTVVFAEETPTAVDLTTTEHIPPIGNQGEVGCCASMAITYMQLTNAVSRYMHEIDPDTDWNPSSGDPSYCFAPRFTYNLAGSGTAWVYEILKEQGAPTQDYAPFSGGPAGYTYDNILAKDWAICDDAWTVAQNYRVRDYDQVWLRDVGGTNFAITTTTEGQALIQRIKQALIDGNVVVTGGFPARWVKETVMISGLGTYGKKGDFATPYSTGSETGGHQVAIVGYDDEITCVKNGVTLKGAFKIANSWGTEWQNDGFLWVMYDAFNGPGQSEYYQLNVADRSITMDQVVFMDWRTDLLIGNNGYTAQISLSGYDRDAFSITLLAVDRTTGSKITYAPYMFNYSSRRPNVPDGLSLTFNGKKSTYRSGGTLVFSFDELVKQFPSGKTADDYEFRVRITGNKRGADLTVSRAALCKDGKPVCVFGDIGDAVNFGTTKTYAFTPVNSGSMNNGGWTFDGEVLTVYGSGRMEDFGKDASKPWDSFAFSIKKVVIDDGITYVGAHAFSHLDSLTEVVCGKDAAEIGEEAFAYNEALTAVTFRGPVSSVGKGTVAGCERIAAVSVSGQTPQQFLTCAGRNADNDGYAKAQISEEKIETGSVSASGEWSKKGTWTLENNVLTISGKGSMPNFTDASPAPWLAYADDILYVVIEDGIKNVGAHAFTKCKELLTVVCGENVVSLGNDAFAYTPVNEITFYGKLRSIGQGSVYRCECLKKVYLTDQTEEEFLSLAHRMLYNESFDGAEFAQASLPPVPFDADGSGSVTFDDALFLLNRLSVDGVFTDVNGDGILSIKDVTATINYIESGKA